MLDQIVKYRNKLLSDRSAVADCISFAALDDVVVTEGRKDHTQIADIIIKQLGCLSLLIATPSLPFAEFLLRRAPVADHLLLPRDTESRTFLHDIPILRTSELTGDPAARIAALLAHRKGIIVEGIGIIATGTLTVEQAYINWSSVFHATFVKYLEDVLTQGFILPEESGVFSWFRNHWLKPLSADSLEFATGPLQDSQQILDEISRVGRYTVQAGLVDSFFGNISYRYGETVYISQTASSLDELSGCIDPVPFDNSSTAGLTASSELVAHQRIFELNDCLAILHGHPRFSVALSMLCDNRQNCTITDCWKDCHNIRYLDGTPVVAGEIGAGGLAKNVPPVINENGRAVVYGHGVFCIGRKDFSEAFQGLVEVENWCRNEYFRRIDQKMASTET
jgi:ribulose-5-phosphate 4-epimerase/fuculose-1-phosphate aldolase